MSGLGEAIFRVSVGGLDITERIDPILESLETHDRSGDTSDTARIVVADVNGRVAMPSVGDDMSIDLGWSDLGIAQVFEGTVDDVRSRGSKDSGRQILISAHGFNTEGKAKEPLEFHKDQASLQDFMSEAAGKAGLSFQAEGAIAGIMRDYWAAGTESFIHLGTRLAREVGACFKIVGSRALMWPLNTPIFSVGGRSSVVARWGSGFGDGNLLEWDISPILGRPRFQTARVRWYDPLTAAWKEVAQGISGMGDTDATHTHRQTRTDEDEADNQAEGNGANSTREAGSGWVVIKGEPRARSEGTCSVVNVRPGVDGGYRITEVTHHLSRSRGFLTTLELKQPQDGAGTDSRTSGDGGESAGNDGGTATPPNDL